MNPGCFSESRPAPGTGAARLGKLAPRRLGTPGPNFLPRRPQRPRRRRDSPGGVRGSPPREGCLSRNQGVARGRRSQPPSVRSLPRRASPQCPASPQGALLQYERGRGCGPGRGGTRGLHPVPERPQDAGSYVGQEGCSLESRTAAPPAARGPGG